MGGSDEPWWRRPAGRIGLVVLLVVAVLGIGIGVRSWLALRQDTSRTVVALQETDNELARADDDLASANDGFAGARLTLDGLQQTLDERRRDRDAAQGELDRVNALLIDVVGQLEAANSGLQSDAARLDALDRCLVGVAQALNQAAVNDTAGMVATIGGIEATCALAGAVL